MHWDAEVPSEHHRVSRRRLSRQYPKASTAAFLTVEPADEISLDELLRSRYRGAAFSWAAGVTCAHGVFSQRSAMYRRGHARRVIYLCSSRGVPLEVSPNDIAFDLRLGFPHFEQLTTIMD